MRRLTLLFLLALAGPAQALRLTAPETVVPAHPFAHSLGAQVEVAGRAPRGTLVELRARCELGPCATTVAANRRGRFEGVLNVVLPEGRRRLSLTVAAGARTLKRTFTLQYTGNDVSGPDLVLVGDSLGVGTEAPLRAALPDWRVTADDRVGRPLAEGMAVLGMLPPHPRPDVLAMGLFTNNDPRSITALDAAVRSSVDRAPCVVWATIARPAQDGVSYRGANRQLRAIAAQDGRLRIVEWARAVHRHPEWLAKDHVHATPTGYAARALLYADAAQHCAGDPGAAAAPR